ncbi:MAG TPA: flagellar filament capping protein FliD [Caproiciproducens sp.]|nr:flagellar filament capping protein FliD [Caproiciproducens sp.]
MTITKSGAAATAAASSSNRLTGLYSGLDTDQLVKNLTMNIQNKIDKQSRNKQLDAWKQTSYREVTKALTEFKSKYFTTSDSSSSILNATFFDSASITNNFSSYVKVSGSTSAAANMIITGIQQLAKQATVNSSYKVSNQAITTGTIYDNYAVSMVSGNTLKVNYDGTDYTLTVNSNLTLGEAGTDPAATAKSVATAVADDLNRQIANNKDLSGKITFGIDSNGHFTIASNDATKNIGITDGSDNLLKGLGLTKTTPAAGPITGGALVADSLYAKKDLSTVLPGTTLTFNLNGLTKTITFDQSDKDKYTNLVATADKPDTLATYIQTKLDSVYGKDVIKVTPKTSGDGISLSFTTTDPTNTSVLTLSSSTTSGVLGMDGALRVFSGASNRVNMNMSLADLASAAPTNPPAYLNTSTQLKSSSPGTYAIKINGAEFDFDNTDTISTIISKINNNSQANVTVSYSSTTDTFSVVSKNGGSSGDVSITDVGSGTLAKTLFGQSAGAQTLKDAGLVADGGTGTINVNGKDFSFNSSQTIDDVVKQINSSSTANISYSTSTHTFSITNKQDGSAATISGTLSTLFDPSKTFAGDYLTSTGKDAVLSVSFDGNPADAQTITRSNNNFTMDGVDFTLLKATDSSVSPNSPITFSVDNKVDDLQKKISDFVADYNNIVKLINGKVNDQKPTDSTYLPLTDDQKSGMTESQIASWETKAKEGLLANDDLLNSLNSDMRASVTSDVQSISSALFQIGIEAKEYENTTAGTLTVNSVTLKNMLTTDIDKVSALFTSADDGIGARLQKIINKYTDPSIGNPGLLVQKAGSDDSSSTYDQSLLAGDMRDCDKEIKTLKDKLKTQQDFYYNKFAKLESYIAQMNSQSSFFSNGSTSS